MTGEVVPPILTREEWEATLADYGEGRGGWTVLAADREALLAERDFYASDCTALLKAEAELVVVRQALTALVDAWDNAWEVRDATAAARAVLAGDQ